MAAERRADVKMVLLCFLVLLFASEALCQSIGYDENTEISVVGFVLKPVVSGGGGLAAFMLTTSSGRSYKVYTAPRWFVNRLHVPVKRGLKVRVVGSKFFGKDGSRCLIARSLYFPSLKQRVILRDQNLQPVWRGAGRPCGSCMKIFFSPSN